MKCNNFDKQSYNQISENDCIICIKCKEDNIPFQKLFDNQFQLICEIGSNEEINSPNLSLQNTTLKNILLILIIF